LSVPQNIVMDLKNVTYMCSPTTLAKYHTQ
jgi:hypothetical protein